MYVCHGAGVGCYSKSSMPTGKSSWQLSSVRSLKSTEACSPLLRRLALVTFNTLMFYIPHCVQCSVVNNRTIFVVKRIKCLLHSLPSMSTLDLVAPAPFPLQSASGCVTVDKLKSTNKAGSSKTIRIGIKAKRNVAPALKVHCMEILICSTHRTFFGHASDLTGRCR